MNVYDMAHGLARNLRQHPDVIALQAAKRKVDCDPKAKEMLDDFMQKSMQLQMQQMAGEEVDAEEQAKLEKLAEILYLHSDIREFQELAMRVDRMLQDIYGIISQAVSPEDSDS
jgi:cell fate (sporulation/competence/biofilm development) regulator YlbF (YheA/YmcA/DUF963 family)